MPQPLFILCPGRSFSSVVAAVIGQHPQCYGLPELNLFLGDTLGEAQDAFARTGRSVFVGLRRTIAELHHGAQTVETVDAAAKWIEQNRHLTPRQVFEHIQELAGDRILVDKSPTNVNRAEVLNRLAVAFPQASFLQLLRHPRSRGVSQMHAMRKQKVRQFLDKALGVIDYEARWTDTHAMIKAFGRALPLGQLMRVRGEDLLRELRLYLPQICEWLNISTAPDAIEKMLHPESSPYSCVGPENAPHGANPGFLENPALDFEKLARISEPNLDAPMEWAPGHNFSQDTRNLAASYGYR